MNIKKFRKIRRNNKNKITETEVNEIVYKARQK